MVNIKFSQSPIGTDDLLFQLLKKIFWQKINLMSLQHFQIFLSEGHFLVMYLLIFHIVKNSSNLLFTLCKGTKSGLPFEPVFKKL